MRTGLPESRRGVASVELAFMLPFLLFLFLATFDWGRVFYYSLTLANVARQGAIYASDPLAATESPYASLQEAAQADATNMTPSPAVTSITGMDASGNAYVEVTATWTFQTTASYPGLGPTILSRTVRMPVQPRNPK